MQKRITKKRILITGGLGMIGKELKELLEAQGHMVYILDLKNGDDIRDYKTCLDYCDGVDQVYHLFGIKGNPRMTSQRPADFMLPMLQGDVNMIRVANEQGVKKFLYTSSIAVENPETDKYPAWAKQTSETLIEAMRIQYPKGTKYCIVRPCNVYGRYDNFQAEECMVISDLIRKGMKNNKVEVWDYGLSERDFINAKDCARGMIQAMNQMPKDPVNLCSGKGVKIIDVAGIIAKELGVGLSLGIPSKPTSRVMKLNWDFKPEISIEEGIKEVIKWQTNCS